MRNFSQFAPLDITQLLSTRHIQGYWTVEPDGENGYVFHFQTDGEFPHQVMRLHYDFRMFNTCIVRQHICNYKKYKYEINTLD
jgi:hypothetical protein